MEAGSKTLQDIEPFLFCLDGGRGEFSSIRKCTSLEIKHINLPFGSLLCSSVPTSKPLICQVLAEDFDGCSGSLE